MLFSQPDYAPDLEWMLQSGQVSPEMLLEALVQEFYVPVYRFVDSTLDNHRLAVIITNETFSTAISQLHSYRPQDGVDIWLFRIAIQLCRRWRSTLQTRRSILATLPFLARPEDFGDSIPESEHEARIWLDIDQLDNGDRQIVIMRYLLDWSYEQIAVLMNISVEAVEEAVKKIRELVYPDFPDNLFSQVDRKPEPADALDQLLTRTLQKRWPVPKTHQENIERLIKRINSRAGRLSKNRHGLVFAMEIAIISLIILVGASLAWGTNRMGSARLASTPSSMVITVIITEYVNVYVTATPAPNLEHIIPTPTPNTLRDDQFITAQTGDTIESLGEREGITAQALREINRIPDDQQLAAGDRLLRPSQWNSLLVNTKRQPNLTEPAEALEPPYLGEEILRRLAVQGPQYDTLWFQAQMIDYGPASYIGPPRLLQIQNWLDGNQSLSLIGYHEQLPSEALMHNKEGTFLAQPSSAKRWFSEWRRFDQDQDQSLTIDELEKATVALFDTRELERGSTFEVDGRERQAGIEALRFDVRNPEGKVTDRIWYDEQRGLILRRIKFLPGDPNTPLLDVQIDQVAYNTTLPGGFFDARIPWRGGFARDAGGNPASLTASRAPGFTIRSRLHGDALPINLSPARSSLSFQYPATFPVDSPFSPVELFANHFLMGNINFSNPWTTLCDRSADGNWLAFESRPLPPYTYTHYLNLIDLSNISAPERHLEQSEGVSVFSFSPDSTEIAFFNHMLGNENGTLSIYNLELSAMKLLLDYYDVKSLIWSPDGKSLGMLARPEAGSYVDYVVVYDLLDDQVTYSTPVDYESNAFQDWPMLKWGVEFPVEMGGMDECAAPPLD